MNNRDGWCHKWKIKLKITQLNSAKTEPLTTDQFFLQMRYVKICKTRKIGEILSNASRNRDRKISLPGFCGWK